MLTKTLLWLYDQLGLVVALSTIVVTIILSNTQAANKVRRKYFAICGTVVCVLLTLVCCSMHKTYSVVPDIYGVTYDDALNSLRNDGLDGRLALASTNENLSSADTRVVWQSSNAGTVLKRDSVVIFVIDDSFATEYKPLISDAVPEQKYTWDWVLSSDTANWTITMPLTDVEIDAHSIFVSGKQITSINGYEFELYSAPMANSLFEIASETCKQYATEMDLGQMQFICKLIPNEPTVYNLERITSDDSSRCCLLPSLLTDGDYRFVFCFTTQSGESYQWEHSITIVPYEEWQASINTQGE